MKLDPVLEDRSTWSSIGVCAIEKAMQVVGSRNAMLIMREAFYGTTRFDDFGVRVGMSDATTAANLKALVTAGLLERRPYQEDGSRARYEYALTQAGTDLMPVVFSLFDWGLKHTAEPPPVELRHDGCGERVHVHMVCDAGHEPAPDDVMFAVRRRKAQR